MGSHNNDWTVENNDLLGYLNQYFYELQNLLQLCDMTLGSFRDLQYSGIMPKASYTLTLSVNCLSFFGEDTQQQNFEYYPHASVQWIVSIQGLSDREVFEGFCLRYQQALSELESQGYHSSEHKFQSGLNQHMATEWQHFLQGTYGLCTKGTPEDVAGKELAISIIESELQHQKEGKVNKSRLKYGVELLERCSALFAPHEYQRSSRYRLAEQVRKEFQL